MKKRVQSGFKGLLVGGLWGGIVGAIALGLLTFVNQAPSTFGTARMWMGAFMVLGLIWGIGIGGILGAVIGASKPN